MAIGGSNPSGGVAPSAPPAGGVRNNQGINAQARGPKTQEMLQKQRLAAKRAVAKKKPAFDVVGVKVLPDKSGKPKPKPKDPGKPADTSTDKPKPPVTTTTKTNYSAANPYGAEKLDPRDENYYANVKAIEATFGAEAQALIAEQTRDDDDTALENAQLADYNRRRVRGMAEARLGSGGSYTGGARDEQIENATDFQNDMFRRGTAYQDRKDQRDLSRARLRSQADRDIRELETETSKLMGEQALNESATSSGDAVVETTTTTTPDKNRIRLQKKIQIQTNRIKQLQASLGDADTPKQKERIRKQINQMKKRRTHAKGKLGK
jgi:hypothetical protein